MSAALKKFAEATNNELFDADYKDGEWMVDAVETHETLEQFAESAKAWVEASKPKHGEVGGFKFIAWASCQAVKGKARRTMSVIDLGDVRYAIEADLSVF